MIHDFCLQLPIFVRIPLPPPFLKPMTDAEINWNYNQTFKSKRKEENKVQSLGGEVAVLPKLLIVHVS